jgi:lon-related putative ATP-dependent protease
VDIDRLRVPADQLCWHCPAKHLPGLDDLKPTKEIVGQPRAVNALRMGLEIANVGYNIFVTGKVGTGRTTTVRRLLDRVAAKPSRPGDKVYVNNFRDPDQPRLIRLPAGQGNTLRRRVDEFVDYLVKNIPQLFEGDNYQRSRQEIVDRFKEQGGVKVRDFEKRIAAEGFALIQTAPFARPELAPIVEKQPVKVDALPGLVEEGKLTAERAEEIKTKYRELSDQLSAIFKEMREYERQAREALAKLDEGFVRPLLEERLADVAAGIHTEGPGPHHRVDPSDGITAWLEEVKTAVLERLDVFRQRPPENQPATEQAADAHYEFRVNVVVDNAEAKTAPVTFETSPTFRNLFGSIDRTWDRGGQARADFTRIKAGSILKSDGGFLVLNALDALLEPGVWPALKRTLRNRKLEIGAYDPVAMFFGATGLKPEPVGIDVKVIMIGDPQVYEILAAQDEDFKKVFKVRADFDWVMDLDAEATREYAAVIKRLCDDHEVAPFDRSGVAAVIEYGVRLAGRRNKLSTRFNIISELLAEASYWAGKAGAKQVAAEHVNRAITERRQRMRLYEDKLQEAIRDGVIYIDTDGGRVGQVNGLAVYEMGEYAFGKPARITARTGVGSAGIINIEREAQLSGPVHDKGIYIIAGYLRGKFAQAAPLVLSASICFEQSYGGVDGDSASSTEVYALLSDLAGLPIRQDVAVTGSVNQNGEVQPIGGVTWKIEGFYEVCKQRGLTGKQGVMIPKANVMDLMLRPDVVADIAAGRFHVWSVESIDQGIELLTGTPAGEPDANGSYPEGTVFARVTKRLRELADIHRSYGKDAGRNGNSAKRRRGALKPKKSRR